MNADGLAMIGPHLRHAEWVLSRPTPIVMLCSPSGCGASEVLAAIAPLTGAEILQPKDPEIFDDLLRAKAERPVVLIGSLDLLTEPEQVAVGPAVLESVARANRRVVIASRTRPSLPLRRWQVDGLAEIVGPDKLRLGREIVGSLIGRRGTEVDWATKVTQGWPSAVALLAHHLRAQPFDVAVALTHQDHVGFVGDEVLSVLSSESGSCSEGSRSSTASIRRSLDAVSGNPAVLGRLRSITERTQLFESTAVGLVWSTDVRAALRNELESFDAQSIPVRHLAAAAAMANDRRMSSVRLGHLVAAGAWQDAMDLVLERWKGLLQPDCFDDLVDWPQSTGGLSTKTLAVPADHPLLLAYTSGTTGRPKGALHVQGGLPVKVAAEAAFQRRFRLRSCPPQSPGRNTSRVRSRSAVGEPRSHARLSWSGAARSAPSLVAVQLGVCQESSRR